MESELKYVTFRDICVHSAFGPRFSSDEYATDGNVACLRTMDIDSNGSIDFEAMPIARLDLSRLNSHILQRDDIVMTRTGAYLGKVAVFTDFRLPVLPGAFSIRFRLDESAALPLYIRYFFNGPEGQRAIQSVATGSAQPNINITNLHTLEIPLPPLPTQRAIAHILGSLDDRIELNRRMNATLEGMAQALFKSWFVDFDPVIDNALVAGNPIPEELTARAELRRTALDNGTANRETTKPFPDAFVETEELGWVPEGWDAATLSDLLEVKYGKDHKKLSEGSIPVYGSGGLMRNGNASLYRGESVLIPRKGTLSNIMYLNEEFWTVDTMFYTIPQIVNVAKYAFHHLKGLDFTLMNVGSAVPSMTTKVLNQLPILLPSETVREMFDGVLTSYFRKTTACDTQSSCLTKLRDTLLPKLISGELRIPDAEKLAEAALA